MSLPITDLIAITECPQCKELAPGGGIAGDRKLWWCPCGHRWEEDLVGWIKRMRSVIEKRAS